MSGDDRSRDKGEGAEAAPGGNKKRMLIIGVVVALALAGGGFFAMRGGSHDPEKQGDKQESSEKAGGHGEASSKKPLVALEPFIVNLADEGEPRYAKFKVEIEVKSESGKKEVEDGLPYVRDAMLGLLSSKRVADIQPAEGKEKLKGEVLAAVNGVLPGKPAVKVLFTDLVTQ